MRLLFILLLISNICSALFGFGRRQSVSVQGRLICDGLPASAVKVKLYEKGFFKDDKLDEGKTDKSGSFRLFGSAVEISTIDPKVNIYHKCNYNGLCYRKFSITIPDNMISTGNVPKQTHDIGTINLGNKFNGEELDCVN